MVYVCVVKSCKAEWKPNSNLSFFSFRKNKVMLAKWLEAIPDLTEVKDYYKICSKHFRTEYIREADGRKYLTRDAIPTIFDTKNIIVINKSEPLPSILREALTSAASLLPREESKRKCDIETQTSDTELDNSSSGKKVCSAQVQTSCKGTTLQEREQTLLKKIKSLQARLRKQDKRLQNTKQFVTFLKNHYEKNNTLR